MKLDLYRGLLFLIYPSIYSFNAPYRGPKQSKEINKLFTSIAYDLAAVETESEDQNVKAKDILSFYIKTEPSPSTRFPTAGIIDGTNYKYAGIDTDLNGKGMVQCINEMRDKAYHFLKNA